MTDAEIEAVALAISEIDATHEVPGYQAESLAGGDLSEWERRTIAKAAIAVLDEMRGWQPIESAPKDGTEFIVGRFTGQRKNHDGHMMVDRWHSYAHGDTYDGFAHFNNRYWPATHWAPLPSPKIVT